MRLETLSLCVPAVTGTMTTMKVDAERMAEAEESEFSTATVTRDGKFGIDISRAPAVYAKPAWDRGSEGAPFTSACGLRTWTSSSSSSPAACLWATPGCW